MTQGATANQGGALTIGEKVGDLRKLLDEKEEELNAVLDDPIATRRLIMVALAAAQKTPKLLECTRSSILLALIEAGSVNLEPSGILGQAALVPFKIDGKLQAVFMPMYQGLIEISYRSGEVKSIYAREVYPEDKFDYNFGLRPNLTHIPDDTHEDFNNPDKITHVYAMAVLKSGERVFEVMTREQIEEVKAVSKAGDKGPWKDWYAMMCRKTIIKRLWKVLPKSPHMRSLAAKDDSIEMGELVPLSTIDPDMASQNAATQTRARLDELGDRIQPGEAPETGSEPPEEQQEPEPEQEPAEQTEAEVVEEEAVEAEVDWEAVAREMAGDIQEELDHGGQTPTDPFVDIVAKYTHEKPSDAPGEPVAETPTPEEPEQEEVAPASAQGLKDAPVEEEGVVSLAPEDRKAVNQSIHSRFNKLLKDVKWELDSGDRRRLLHTYVEKGLKSIGDLTDDRALKMKNHLYQDSDKIRVWLMDEKKKHEEGQSATE